jgi:hypothetical protein
VLDDGGSMSSAWENIRENTKISVQESLYCELMHNKPWFDEEGSLFRLKEASQIVVDEGSEVKW